MALYLPCPLHLAELLHEALLHFGRQRADRVWAFQVIRLGNFSLLRNTFVFAYHELNLPRFKKDQAELLAQFGFVFS
ncbi:hypothetical protein D3C72_2338830 [compost metagenome]